MTPVAFATSSLAARLVKLGHQFVRVHYLETRLAQSVRHGGLATAKAAGRSLPSWGS